MPNARVGALPQTSTQDEMMYRDHHDRGRGGRQHGITMQDLKKQTAIRLAEEHHQMRSGNRQNQQVQLVHNQRSPPNPQGQHQFPNQMQSQSSMHHDRQSQYPIQRNEHNYTQNLMRNQPQKPITKNFPPSQYNHDHPSMQNNQANVNRAPYQNHRVNDLREMPGMHNANLYSSQTRHRQSGTFSTPSQMQHGVVSNHSNNKGREVSMPHHHKNKTSANGSHGSSLQMAAGKMKNPNMNNMQRYPSIAQDTSSVVSTTSSKSSSRGGSSSNSISAHSSMYSRPGQQLQHQHQHHKNKQPPETSLHSRNMHHQQQYHQHQTSGHRPGFSNEGNGGMKSNTSMRNQPNTQNKLPHGLTVNELKEMTRARLAAEAAAEKSSQSSDSRGGTNDLTSQFSDHNVQIPLQVHRNQLDKHIKSRNASQPAAARMGQSTVDAASNWHRMFPQQEFHGGKGTPIHQRPHQRKNHPRAHQGQNMNVQFSMQPKDFHAMPENQNHLSYGNRNERNRPHLDSVDSCSVTSFNSTIASEYMGSENTSSAYLGSNIQQPPHDEDMSFVRSWSYPSASVGHGTSHDGIPSSSSYFDSSTEKHSSLIGSRRRLGSSPPGIYLEVPHEDQPLSLSDEIILPRVVVNEHPVMRTFEEFSHQSLDSSISRQLHSREPSYQKAPIRQNVKSDVLGSELQNQNMINSSSGGHVSSHSSNEELPNWVAESVLGTPLLRNHTKAINHVNSDITGNEDSIRGGFDGIFRAQNDNFAFPNNTLTATASHGYLYSDASIIGRSEGGSWGGSTSVKSAPDFHDFLNQDFSNLLSFSSGLEVKTDSIPENKYGSSVLKSRIDPELIDSPCSVNRMAHSSPSKLQYRSGPGSAYLGASNNTSIIPSNAHSSPSSKVQRNREIMSNKNKQQKSKELKENDALTLG